MKDGIGMTINKKTRATTNRSPQQLIDNTSPLEEPYQLKTRIRSTSIFERTLGWGLTLKGMSIRVRMWEPSILHGEKSPWSKRDSQVEDSGTKGRSVDQGQAVAIGSRVEHMDTRRVWGILSRWVDDGTMER